MILFFIYNFFLYLLYLPFLIVSVCHKKVKIFAKNRKNSFKLLKQIKTSKNIVLVHNSSLGEYEQIFPLLKQIKENKPDIFIIVSFFSDSGYNYVKDNTYIDLKIYLPLDFYFSAQKFFSLIKPKLWIISAYDVWPNFVFVAKKNKIPIVISSAVLSEKSKRNKGLSLYFNKFIYKNINEIYPISLSTKENFKKIYPFENRLFAFGDVRFDRIWQKAEKEKNENKQKIFQTDDFVFIVGSSHKEDEKVLLPILTALLKKYPNFKLIFAPHKISTENILSLKEHFKEFAPLLLTQNESFKNENKVLLVDCIGKLFSLYNSANLAFIGGSFSSNGLHNIIEAAVFGLPTIFGPNYFNSVEAIELTKNKGSFSVNNDKELNDLIEKFLKEKDFYKQTQEIAQNFVKNNLGADRKTYKQIQKYL